jgi:hypothetical protein
MTRRTAAGTVRVATSIIPVSSTRPGTPSSSMTITSSGVESISISSPGAAGQARENIRCGRPARPRRVAADPVVCLPADSRENSRNIVARDGSICRLIRPGGRVQDDYWFPPAEIPLGHGKVAAGAEVPLVLVLVMASGYSRWMLGRSTVVAATLAPDQSQSRTMTPNLRTKSGCRARRPLILH